jgi:hypothetical protein
MPSDIKQSADNYCNTKNKVACPQTRRYRDNERIKIGKRCCGMTEIRK